MPLHIFLFVYQYNYYFPIWLYQDVASYLKTTLWNNFNATLLFAFKLFEAQSCEANVRYHFFLSFNQVAVEVNLFNLKISSYFQVILSFEAYLSTYFSSDYLCFISYRYLCLLVVMTISRFFLVLLSNYSIFLFKSDFLV